MPRFRMTTEKKVPKLEPWVACVKAENERQKSITFWGELLAQRSQKEGALGKNQYQTSIFSNTQI